MGLKNIGRALTAVATGGISEIGGSKGFGGQLFGFGSVKADGTPYTQEEITTANLFKNLSPEQQKDLLLNNPNIVTPQGGQNYNPLTNTISLTESDFTKAERLRQEGLASQLSGSLSGDFSNNAQAIQDATFERGKAYIDPIVKQQKRDLAQQLADQGIPAGSEGYKEAMDRLDDSIARQYTDLTQASIQTSEQVRAQRFNEIASLLGRSQVGAGASFSQNATNFSGLDLFGAEQAGINRNFQQGIFSQQIKQQNKNAIYQALGSAGAAGITAVSDINLKQDIKFIEKEKGFDIYEFSYINKEHGEGTYRGVMAQDLLKSNPEAVILDKDGFLKVDYSKIDIDFRRVK